MRSVVTAAATVYWSCYISGITTASVWQVRQKLYDSAIGRWRLYQRHLGPLIDGLDGLLSDHGEAHGEPTMSEPLT